MAGCCEYGNEPSGSIKGGKFLDQLSDFIFSRRTLPHRVSFVIYQSFIPGPFFRNHRVRIEVCVK
jgi:hypothetical protein